MKTNKKTARYMIPASLVAGGMLLGTMFSPISLSGAQTGDDSGSDPTTDVAPPSDATASEEGGHARGGRHHRGLGKEVLEDLGLSVEDLKAGHEAGLTLVEIAAQAGISEADLVAALENSASERLAEAVADGKIDADKAAEIEAGMSERIAERINTVQEGRPGGEGRGQRREDMIETLTDLGLDADALQAGREDGKSLAEVAAAAGVSEDDLVDALVAGAQERLDQAVENGRIDADKQTEIVDGLEERITERVNNPIGERAQRGNRGGRPGAEGDAEA